MRIDNNYKNENFKEVLIKDYNFTTDLLKIKPIDEEQKKFMIFIGGKAAASYQFESESDARLFIEKKPYSIIFALIAAMIDANEKIHNSSWDTENAEKINNEKIENSIGGEKK